MGAAAVVEQQGQDEEGGRWCGGRIGHGLLAGVALQLGLDARPAAITNAGGGVLRLVAEAPAGLRLVHAHARGHGDVGQPPRQVHRVLPARHQRLDQRLHSSEVCIVEHVRQVLNAPAAGPLPRLATVVARADQGPEVPVVVVVAP